MLKNDVMLQVEIKLLADCPEYIPDLSQLWLNEIGKQWIPNASAERAQQTFQAHLNRTTLPLTFVAISHEKPIGMVSLRDNDGIRDDLTPWLGSLIVDPDYRRQYLGEKLVDMTKQQAKFMGHEKLYLFTLDPTIHHWYAKLGWKAVDTDKLYHHPVTVMEIVV